MKTYLLSAILLATSLSATAGVNFVGEYTDLYEKFVVARVYQKGTKLYLKIHSAECVIALRGARVGLAGSCREANGDEFVAEVYGGEEGVYVTYDRWFRTRSGGGHSGRVVGYLRER